VVLPEYREKKTDLEARTKRVTQTLADIEKIKSELKSRLLPIPTFVVEGMNLSRGVEVLSECR